MNIPSIIEKLKTIYQQYKWLLLPVLPLLIFLVLLLTLIFSPSHSPTTTTDTPPTTKTTPAPVANTYDRLTARTEGLETEEPIEKIRPKFEEKTSQPDGTVLYTFTSENPKRPNILIITANNEPLYSRNVSEKEEPIASLSLIKSGYGEPERTVQGTSFYGPNSVIYIYSSVGNAYVGNPETNETYEEHLFPPMTPEEYLELFGKLN